MKHPFIFGARNQEAPSASVDIEINGVVEDTITAPDTFELIATLDGVAGGNYNAGTHTLSFTSNTGWIRNPDWLTLPTITSADNRLVALMLVFENEYNELCVQGVASVAQINWGDGVTQAITASNIVHVYDYATISATVYQYYDGRNYKQVIVDVTKTASGALSTLYFMNASAINPNGTINLVDVSAALPQTTAFGLSYSGAGYKKASALERIRIYKLPTSYADWTFLQRAMPNLKVYDLPWSDVGNLRTLASVGTWGSVIYDIGNITNTVSGSLAYDLQNSSFWKCGDVVLSSSDVSFLFTDNKRCEQYGTFTLANATTVANTWQNNYACRKIGTVSIPSATTIASAWNGCTVLGRLVVNNCGSVTNAANAVLGCYTLAYLEMNGLTRGTTLVDTNLGNVGMSAFANSLGTAAGAQTITVTSTPFGALLTALDVTAVAIAAVMTGKGFTVVN